MHIYPKTFNQDDNLSDSTPLSRLALSIISWHFHYAKSLISTYPDNLLIEFSFRIELTVNVNTYVLLAKRHENGVFCICRDEIFFPREEKKSDCSDDLE